MKGLNGKSIRTVCLSLAVALAASFALAEMPGLNDGPPDMDRKMKLGQSSGVSSSAPAEQYIVTLDDTAAGDPAVQAAVIREVEALGGTVYRRFSFVLNGGFAATLPTRALETLQSNPNVAFVEPDAIIGGPPAETTAAISDTTAAINDAAEEDEAADIYGCPWHLDHLNQTSLPNDGYCGFTATGAACSVWVIDTGIRATHDYFGGRAQQKENFAGGQNVDCNGHGTHVASLVAAIATEAQIRGVKVLGCSGAGSTSGVISGIEYVINNAGSNSIAVLGLGGGLSPTLDTALNNMVNAGIATVVAAGNENADACYSSPARAEEVLTVAATAIDDSRADFSNWGPCVDVFAPGRTIFGAWNTSDTAAKIISGTAMSTGVAGGMLALYSCGDVSALLANALPNVVSDPGPGTPNLYVYHP